MEYQFRSVEWNSLKGTIGEHLARSFIRTQLAPRLMFEESWDQVVLSNNDYKQNLGGANEKLFSYDRFREDFMVHGFYADKKLLSKYAMVVGVLRQNHCTPDGLLLKMRDTGRMKRLREKSCRPSVRLRLEKSRKRDDFFEFPIVTGDLEVIEIKCGRNARLVSKQKETYNNLIASDVPLRLVKVGFVSFDRNRFLVEEHKYERFL